MAMGGLLSFPVHLSHGAVKAACTYGWRDFGELLWYLASQGEGLNLGKQQVSKAMMPAHQLGLLVSGNKVDLVIVVEWRGRIKGEWLSSFNVPVLALGGGAGGEIAREDRLVIRTCSLKD